MNAQILTDRESIVLKALIEYISENQYPPSFREIISSTELTTTSMVSYYYNSLTTKGYIKKADNKSRAIKILQKSFDWYEVIVEGKE